MGTLTVRENIAFSAALRLPSTYTREDRRQKVDFVIKELGLTTVADKKVNMHPCSYTLYKFVFILRPIDTPRLVQLRTFLKEKEN